MDDGSQPAVSFFRLIVARIYEGEAVVKAMDAHAGIVGFMSRVPDASRPAGALRMAYRRDRAITRRDQQSEVERAFARARHLTVHYSQYRGELARILRHGRALEVRARIAPESQRLRYLWAQDVMQHALWPTEPDARRDIEYAAALTQAFTDLFLAVRAPYMIEMGVQNSDVLWLDANRAD